MSDEPAGLNADAAIGVTVRRDWVPVTASIEEALKRQPAEQRRYVSAALQRKREQNHVER